MPNIVVPPLNPVSFDALVNLFSGHNASPDSPSETMGAGEASPLKGMDPADLRLMLDDVPRSLAHPSEVEVFTLIEELESIVKPRPRPALDEWFDEREAEAREAMDNDPNLKKTP